MSAKTIVKTINLLGLPEGFEILTPIEYQRANNPPPGCVIVYAAQCVSRLRFPLHPFLVDLLVTLGIPPSQLNPNSYRLVVEFLLCCQLYCLEPSVENFLGIFSPRLTPGECFFHFTPRLGLVFIHEKPSSYGAWKNRFFFIRKAEWEIPLVWRPSPNDLPPINLELVKERVKVVGLLDHGFKAKALVEKDILIVAGLHPVPDPYTGPESRYLQTMMNRAAVRKFLPENVPSNPLSSPSTRSASTTPLIFNRVVGVDPLLVHLQRSGLTLLLSARFPRDTPIPPWRLPSQKRPRVEEVPLAEEAIPPSPTPTAAPPSFPLPVMTPQFTPKARVSNMYKATNKGDVEFLFGRSMESLAHLLLFQTTMTPPIVVAMIECYEKLRANLKAALS
ncbi:hypothetical protein Salat_1414700 [Sesamum alatum]|uniref:Transposase (putative) gypsy type domain-containing protein n=1 Tax=Sesamum alatum TaxID=300844 RepID=A0AAE1YA35_9LAMI|nr:hypothetical protein Salat_1414700 [Sesamum alatum]